MQIFENAFESKEKEVAVFKGGTSLSKAYRLGNRFSEDIDIAITSDQARFKEPEG